MTKVEAIIGLVKLLVYIVPVLVLLVCKGFDLLPFLLVFVAQLARVDDHAGRVDVFERVVPRVGVQTQLLRINHAPWRYGDGVRAGESPLRPREVPGPEVIQPRFGVAFFAGTTGSDVKIVQRMVEAGRGVGDSGANALVENRSWELMAQSRVWG